jgi:hypothetical protein
MRRPSAVLAVLAGVAAVAGCRTASPPPSLSPQWSTLAGVVPPFSALYRLTCCGERALPTVVRANGRALSLTVAVPPGGVAWEAWLEDGEAWMHRAGRACRLPLPAGEVPVGRDARIPLAPDLAGYLLGGRLPADSVVAPDDPDEVVARVGPWRLRARVVGVPPRWVAAAVDEPEAGGEPIAFFFGDRRDGRPGRVEIRTGKRDVLLDLVQWLPGGPSGRPEWLSLPVCPQDHEER